jgi:hypothetical protein
MIMFRAHFEVLVGTSMPCAPYAGFDGSNVIIVRYASRHEDKRGFDKLRSIGTKVSVRYAAFAALVISLSVHIAVSSAKPTPVLSIDLSRRPDIETSDEIPSSLGSKEGSERDDAAALKWSKRLSRCGGFKARC